MQSMLKFAALGLFVFTFSCGERDSADSKTLATLSDFCDKCAECFKQPGFSEGFCSPFITNGSFERLSCTRKGDPSELKTHELSAGDVHDMSCAAFDEAE